MKKQLIRASAATILALSLTGGFAAADTVSNTGRDSTNTVSTSNNWQTTKTNNNRARVGNFNGQLAASGDAHSSSNTNGGDASTGSAGNANKTNTSVSYTNTGGGATAVPTNMGSGGGGTIDTTGRDSTNTISTSNNYQATETNNNSANVENVSLQGAFSGDARSNSNTKGGNATTGDVSNSNDTTTSVSYSN